MPDYKRMYALLCSSIDDVIEPLRSVSGAEYYAECLQKALLKAEKIYINCADDETGE